MLINISSKIYGVPEGTDTKELINVLIATAEMKDLEVHRFSTNASNFHSTVHWAVVPKGTEVFYYDHPTNKKQSAVTYGPGVYVGGREGITTRCRAYKQLEKLLMEII